jgi:hypothetical protein
MGSVHVRQFRGQVGVATPDMVGEGALVKRPMGANPLLCPLLAGQGVVEPAPRRLPQGPETGISLELVAYPLPFRLTMR